MDFHLMVRALPYGGHLNGKDGYGTFFSPRTNFWMDQLPLPKVFRRHGFGESKPRPIGKSVRFISSSDGGWFEVVLPYTPENLRLYTLAQRNQLYASSGAISHFVRTLPSGEQLVWPIVDISLLTLEEKPANMLAVALAQAVVHSEESQRS